MGFPISYEYRYYVHRGGTKDYHLYWLRCGDRQLIIRRFGKIDSWGQLQFERYEDANRATEAFGKLHRERTGRTKGYEEKDHERKFGQIHDQQQFTERLGGMAQALTTGANAEQGRWLMEGLDNVDDRLAREFAKPEPEAPSTTADNPDYGSF